MREEARVARESLFCEICQNENNFNFYQVKEQMIGLNEKFTYSECLNCGCLQLRDVPSDFTKYYDNNYYSMIVKQQNWIKKKLKNIRFNYAIGEKSLLGLLLTKKFGVPHLISWLKEIELDKNDKILDVGCGYGQLLIDLYDLGYRNLTGADLFIKNEIQYKPTFKIFNCSVFDLQDEYDLIMLHHSFEHMSEPIRVLNNLKSKLKSGKTLLLRMPLADSGAWKKYGIYWASLDAPRHIFLHTKKSVSIMAERTGFRISKIKYDSSSFQFWASEQYSKGIPLLAENSFAKNPAKSIFSSTQIKDFESTAQKLNGLSLGDQACFFLTK